MASTPTPTPAPEAEKPKPPDLDPEQALSLFRNGDRIAKHGDPPEKWMTMSRLGDGTPVVQTPLTDELLGQIKKGKFYLAQNG